MNFFYPIFLALVLYLSIVLLNKLRNKKLKDNVSEEEKEFLEKIGFFK